MSTKYRSDIDGLRALAVLSVVIFHLNNHWLHGGFVGVDIFFVISGFLITKIIFEEILNGHFSFKSFYLRRINRILPVFFVVMLSTLSVVAYISTPDKFVLTLDSLKATTYFWQNIFFANNTGGYWDTSAAQIPTLHTWSLAVEEQFYIILPLFLIFILNLKLIKKTILHNKYTIPVIFSVIAISSFALSQISPWIPALSKYNYYSLLTSRAGELMIGSIAGIAAFNNQRDVSKQINRNNILENLSFNNKNIITTIGFIMIAFSAIFLSEEILFPGFFALIPTIGAVLIIYFHDRNTYVCKLLSLKPIVFIGTLSYSIYLWHWPVIVLFREYYNVYENFNIVQCTNIILITSLLSLSSFYLIESPCRKLKKGFACSFLVYYTIPLIIILSMHAKKDYLLHLIYSDRIEVFNLERTYLNPASNFCHNVIYGGCTFGDRTKKTHIIMIGDSNAGHYSPFLDEAGKRYGFSIAIFSQDACWGVPGLVFSDPVVTNTCQNFAKKISSEIEKYDVVFIAGKYQDSIIKNDGNEKILVDQIKKMKAKGKRVIVLSQIPYLHANEYSTFNREYLHGRKYITSNFIQQKELDAVNKVLDHDLYGIAQIFTPLDYLNTNHKASWPIYNGLIGYKDIAHLNEYVTRQWSEEVLLNSNAFWSKLVINNVNEAK